MISNSATPWTVACQAPLSPGNCSNWCPLSWWCYLTISFSATPLSSCLQSFPASGSFPMSQFFASGGQSTGASVSASVCFSYVLMKVLFIYLFIFISWRLITLQHCSGFCHTLTWISHGFTCVPHLDPPSHLLPHQHQSFWTLNELWMNIQGWSP